MKILEAEIQTFPVFCDFVSKRYDNHGDVDREPETLEGGANYNYNQNQDKYKRQELTNDMNRRLNEIFEHFGEDDDDPKTYH